MRITPRRLLMVWAHPDDEAYLAAALAARTSDAGGTVRCVTATHGEAGFPDDDHRSFEERCALRLAELRASLATMGVEDVSVLDFPDGGCADVDDLEGSAAVQREIVAFRPDVIVTFEPQGITLHPDHRAVSRWTTLAWAATGVGSLLYAVHTDSYHDEFADMNAELGVYIGGGRPDPTPDAEVTVDLRLSSDEIARKRLALAAHASQTAGIVELIGEERYRQWWRRETFRPPHPAELRATARRPARV